MLLHDRQAQTTPCAGAPCRSTCETFEDSLPFAGRHSWSCVHDDQLHVVVAVGKSHLRGTTCVVKRILQEVGEDSFDPSAISLNDPVLANGIHWDVLEAIPCHYTSHRVQQIDLFHMARR